MQQCCSQTGSPFFPTDLASCLDTIVSEPEPHILPCKVINIPQADQNPSSIPQTDWKYFKTYPELPNPSGVLCPRMHRCAHLCAHPVHTCVHRQVHTLCTVMMQLCTPVHSPTHVPAQGCPWVCTGVHTGVHRGAHRCTQG